jgi:hypothetical protein
MDCWAWIFLENLKSKLSHIPEKYSLNKLDLQVKPSHEEIHFSTLGIYLFEFKRAGATGNLKEGRKYGN